MGRRWTLCVMGWMSASLAGCAGVPALYADHQPSKLGVQAITKQISCELYKSPRMADLAKGRYFITVLLTLQVDDNLDFTPSLGFIHPFTAAMTNVTTSVGGDLGGARRRTFTTTYTLDAFALQQELAAAESPQKAGDATRPFDWCANFAPEAKRSFALNGKLGLSEIVEDGLGILDPGHKAIHIATGATDKAAPSFGSYVQFIITRSITSLGPIWTVKQFKGPGGTNGLFNAKRLDTDSVLLTFAPQPPTGGQTPQQKQAASFVKSEQTNRDTTAATVLQFAATNEQNIKAARTARALVPTNRSGMRMSEVDRSKAATADEYESQARVSGAQLRNAQIEAESAQFRLSAAKTAAAIADQEAAAASDEAPATAINAAQSLQQTMLLQNLAGSLAAH